MGKKAVLCLLVLGLRPGLVLGQQDSEPDLWAGDAGEMRLQCAAAGDFIRLGWIAELASDQNAIHSARQEAVDDFKKNVEAAFRRALAQKVPEIPVTSVTLSEEALLGGAPRPGIFASSFIKEDEVKLRRGEWVRLDLRDSGFGRTVHVRVEMADGTILVGRFYATNTPFDATAKLRISRIQHDALGNRIGLGPTAEAIMDVSRRTTLYSGCRKSGLRDANGFCLYNEKSEGEDAYEVVRVESLPTLYGHTNFHLQREIGPHPLLPVLSEQEECRQDARRLLEAIK